MLEFIHNLKNGLTKLAVASAITSAVAVLPAASQILPGQQIDSAEASDHAQRVASYWTSDRIASAVPLGLDHDPIGANAAAFASTPQPNTALSTPETPSPDTLTITPLSPADGAEAARYTPFQVRITGISSPLKYVIFYFLIDGAEGASFGQYLGDNIWEVRLPMSESGPGEWMAHTQDTQNNWVVTDTSTFEAVAPVYPPHPTEPDPDYPSRLRWVQTPLEHWQSGGTVQTATGQILFELPTDRAQTDWIASTCAGSVVTDETSGRSIILTSARCVYSDTAKAFARNVLFVPNGSLSEGLDASTACSATRYGCWSPQFGAVSARFANSRFPDNAHVDYGYYVVEDQGARIGPSILTTDALDAYAGSLQVTWTFSDPLSRIHTRAVFVHAFGFTEDDAPVLARCAEPPSWQWRNIWGQDSTEWHSGIQWLRECELPPSTIGGPWLQDFDPLAGTGMISSVNSRRIEGISGANGPYLFLNNARCVFETARATAFNEVLTQDGEAGLIVTNCP